jgi:uncharacterized protein
MVDMIKKLKRTISDDVTHSLNKKIVLLTGPRQTGKTTLAKMLHNNYDYLNFDYLEHRTTLLEKSWDRKKKLVIFDELHKMKNWKCWLKGIYDVEGLRPNIIVTGSARLDIAKKTGDSLAGRYFSYRLHPFDIKELKNKFSATETFDRLMKYGGFPEPFLENSDSFYGKWKRTHLNIILRQDLIDLESVHNITSIETLIELLKSRVGSPISYSSLARDLDCAPKTIKRWLNILENLYIIFSVRPYHKNIGRAILKEPKYYFYDVGQIKDDESIKLENLVACALLKELNYLEDVNGLNTSLNYIKNKDGKEIDFAVSVGNKYYLIEVKLSDNKLSNNFKCFNKYFKSSQNIQLVKNLTREKTYPDGSEIRNVVNWLEKINLK